MSTPDDGSRDSISGHASARHGPLPSSLFPLPSSLFPLPSSLFPLPSSLFPPTPHLRRSRQRRMHAGPGRPSRPGPAPPTPPLTAPPDTPRRTVASPPS